MLSRIGKVTVGVTVGLVAVAPLAWAGGTGYDSDGSAGHDKGTSQHDDRSHGPERDRGGHEDGGRGAGATCSFDGGAAESGSLISGQSLAAAVSQAPVAGDNIANLANCSDFLNDSFNGNLSGNQVVIGDSLPLR